MSNDEDVMIEFPHASQLKISVCGDPIVGKTVLVQGFVKNEISEHKPTAGADISFRKIPVGSPDEGKEISAIFWDLSGQPVFQNVRPIFYEGSHGVVYVYDITRADTIINLPKWVKEATRIVGKETPSILIGNKTDMENERKISLREGQMFADGLGVPLFEVCALTGTNVNKAFAEIIRRAFAYRLLTQ